MQFIVAAPVALLGHLLLDTGNFRFNITPNLIVSLLYNGIIASIFLTLIHTSVQKYSTPVKAALIFSLEPVFATIVAIFALNEFLGGREMSGAAILLFGVIVSEVGENVYNSVKKMIK
jgi:drug/metabolite transporter (DMT)-like permease